MCAAAGNDAGEAARARAKRPRGRVPPRPTPSAAPRVPEDVLRREWALSTAVLETAGALVVVLDRQGRIVRFNRACEQTTGYTFAEVRGRPFWELLLLPEEVAPVRTVFDELRAGQFPNQHENYWVGKDGSRRLIAWSNTALLDGTGAVEHVIGTGIDITGRTRAEAALRDSESRMRCVLDTIVDAIITIDEQGIIQAANPAAERIFGYRAQEVLGQEVSLLMPAPQRHAHAGYLEQHLRTGEERIIGRGREVVAQRKDGTTFPADLAVGAAVLGGGRLFTGIIRDITERKRAELELRRAHDDLERRVAERTAELRAANEQLQQEVRERRQAEAALRASEERLRSICAAAPVGIFEADRRGQCIYTNERLQAICGLTSAELQAGGWQQRVHPHDRQAVTAELDRATRAGQPDHRELRLLMPDGSVRWVALRTAVLHGPDGLPTGTVGMLEDITERRQAEDETRRREMELAHVSRLYSMGEMATTVAHELNQPLAAIANYSQGGLRRLQSGSATPEDLTHAFERIAEGASRAGQIISAVRGLARRRGTEPAPISANEVVCQAVRILEPEARHWGATIQVELAEELPEVAADRIQIEQVILNLLRNGLEAMLETPAELRVLRVGTAPAGTTAVEFAVGDRGCGLPPALYDRVFEPFYSTKPHGMGVGLSICRSIIRGHGGRIWAESQPGQGATFRFTLPVARSAPSGG